MTFAELKPNKIQSGGEFNPPCRIGRLLAEVIKPYHGRILDPHAVRAASSSPKVSRNPPPNSPSTASRRPRKPDASAA